MAAYLLESSDGQTYTVDRDMVKHAGLIEKMVTDAGYDGVAPLKLDKVTGATLEIVVAWLMQHKDDGPFDEKASEEKKAEDIADWDREFLAKHNEALNDLINAADTLDVKGLLEVCCQTVACMINGKTAKEMGELFGIECDFTEAELEEIRKENAWCEQ